MPDLTEHAQQEFEAAADFVASLDDDEFRDYFQDLYIQWEEFDPETDAILMSFELDSTDGIDRWRMQHLDTTAEGDIWDKQKYVRHFDDDDDAQPNPAGINTFDLYMSLDDAPSPDESRAGFYAVFDKMSENPKADLVISNPSLMAELKSTDDGFSISFNR